MESNSKINEIKVLLGEEPRSPHLRYQLALEYVAVQAPYSELLENESQFWSSLFSATAKDQHLLLPRIPRERAQRADKQLRLALAIGFASNLQSAKAALLHLILRACIIHEIRLEAYRERVKEVVTHLGGVNKVEIPQSTIYRENLEALQEINRILTQETPSVSQQSPYIKQLITKRWRPSREQVEEVFYTFVVQSLTWVHPDDVEQKVHQLVQEYYAGDDSAREVLQSVGQPTDRQVEAILRREAERLGKQMEDEANRLSKQRKEEAARFRRQMREEVVRLAKQPVSITVKAKSREEIIAKEAIVFCTKHLARSPHDIECLQILGILYSTMNDQYRRRGVELQLERAMLLADSGVVDQTIISPPETRNDGIALEELVAKLLAAMGYRSELTKRSADGGIDIVAIKDEPISGGTYLIQCKDWSSPVGEPVLRDLYGLVVAEAANKGIIITTGSFTKSAEQFAQGKQLELIDGSQLNALAAQFNL